LSTQFDEVNIVNIARGLAKVVKDRRSQLGMDRSEFEFLSNLQKDFMARVEHGEAPVKARRALRHMICDLNLSDKKKSIAFVILERLCPRRQERRKVHLRIGILQQRRGGSPFR
jgi:hypothetical protein